MMMRINLTKMVLAQIIPTQKITDLTMRKNPDTEDENDASENTRTRTRKKILLIMKIQKILVPIMRTREKKHPTTVTLPRMPVIQQTIQTTAVHLIQLLPFLSIPEFS